MSLSLVPKLSTVAPRTPVAAPASWVPTGGIDTGTTTTITVLPDTVNINIYAGDDFTMTLSLTDPDGTPTSLTGTTVTAQIRTAPGAPIVASFSCATSENVITLTLVGTDTQMLAGNYDWDCQVVNQIGVVWTAVAGTIAFTQDITR